MDLDLFLSHTLYNDVLAFALALFFTIWLIWQLFKVITLAISASILKTNYKNNGNSLFLLYIIVTLLWTWFYYAQLWSFI